MNFGSLEARVGIEPLSRIDPTQLAHSTTRQKRQNGQISPIEVHAGYTETKPSWLHSGIVFK